jgi:hypothetical protein
MTNDRTPLSFRKRVATPNSIAFLLFFGMLTALLFLSRMFKQKDFCSSVIDLNAGILISIVF